VSRLCFLKNNPAVILRVQVVLFACSLVVVAVSRAPTALALPVVVALGPAAYLRVVRRRRSKKVTAQADSFLLGLANSLKAVPTIGAALTGLLPVLQSPLREEMTLALNELRVGNSIDQALLNVASRAQSPALDGALSALLVGRQVGGDLPKILETTAATLREIHRLEGVVQSKTSESRAQLWVLACFPLGILFLFSSVSPGFFDPLFYTFTGQIVSVVAAVFWGAAVLLARQLSKVDL
jgi:tight adherence protein B